jgi:hypothetical protein
MKARSTMPGASVDLVESGDSPADIAESIAQHLAMAIASPPWRIRCG